MKLYEGMLKADSLKIGVVVSRFNEFITSKLLAGAEDAFIRHGGEEDILCLFNFSEKAQDYRLRLDYNLELELLLASDADIYSGTEHYEGETVLKKKKGYFELPMTPYSAKFFKMK